MANTQSDTDRPVKDRRNFLRVVAGSSVLGTSSLLAGCGSGGDGGGDDGDGGGDGGDGDGGMDGGDGGGDGDGDGGDGGRQGQGGIQLGGDLTLGLVNDPPEFKPHTVGSFEGRQLLIQIGNQLVNNDREGNIVPDLAEEWEVLEGGTKYVFTLREGVMFHEPYDRELKAEDVVENFHALLDPDYGAPAYGQFQGTLVADGRTPEDSVYASGEYEVTFELENPFAPFTTYLTDARGIIIPMESYEEHGERLGTTDVGAWGTGPFRYVEGEDQDHYTLERNEDYFKEDESGNQLPYTDSITIRIVPESQSRITGLQTGDLNVAINLPGRIVNQQPDNMEVVVQDGTRCLGHYLNHRNWEPADSQQFRQALEYALNKRAIIETAWQGAGSPGVSVFPQWHYMFDEDVVVDYGPDEVRVEEAQSRLEDAGYDGEEFDIITTNVQHFTDSATVAQQNYRQVGLQANVRPTEKGQGWLQFCCRGWEEGPKQEFQSAIEDSGRDSLHPDSFTANFMTTRAYHNFMFFQDDQLDEWGAESRRTTDEDQRRELYNDMAARYSELAPTPLIVWEALIQGTDVRTRNYAPFPEEDIELEAVWLEQ